MVERKDFGQVIEGEPLEMRRLSTEEVEATGMARVGSPVGIFRIYMSGRKSKLLGVVDFDDLFDENGNRFIND